jgi:predicted nucleotidyltransferase
MKKIEILRKLAVIQGELEKYSVRHLYVFGSFARDEEGKDSDLDILVEFDPDAKIGLFALARLRRRLMEVMGREVDLVTPEAIRPEMREEILREAVLAA